MRLKHTEKDVGIEDILKDLERLRRFQGKPGEFWGRFIKGCTLLIRAGFGLLLVKDEQAGSWKNHGVWPAERWTAMKGPEYVREMETAAEAAAHEGFACHHLDQRAGDGLAGAFLGVRLDLGEDKRLGVAVFHMAKNSGIDDTEARVRLQLVADTPLAYQMRRVADKAKSDVIRYVEALDLMVLLNAQKRYMAAAMCFCNELSARFACTRVSLGWLKDGYIRIQAISHMEKFEKKMDAVQSLETAMEEAFDQDEEVVYPQPEGGHLVTRDHEAFALAQGVKNLASLPIRLDDELVGVLTCERGDNPFTEYEIYGLRLICDQAARRLGDLKKHDRWFGARMAESIREALLSLLGVKHTFVKCLGLIICLALAFLLFGTWQYRVEAPFILKTDDLAFLPAPFDGYIHEVHVQVGDEVKENDPLLALDTLELLLEESAAIADRTRYEGEAEKARARNALAEMKIALALKDQAEAKLELIRFHLANARILAPFSGIVVEGELKELQGAPVRKGDVLFKIARIEKMYAELDINERDVHEVAAERTGEIAFISMPDKKFPITLEVINPIAVAKEDGNVFPARGLFIHEPEGWWRPGMSGIAKVNVGKRNLLWIFTHRTIDFLRMWLWW